MNRLPLFQTVIFMFVISSLPLSAVMPAWLNYPDTLTWGTLPNTLQGCSNTAGAYLDGKFYQISGDQWNLILYPHMQVWDGVSWQQKGTHPAYGIQRHSAAVWNGKIVVSGGDIWDSPGHYDKTTIFNPMDSSWVDSTPMPMPGLRSAAMASINGVCYLLGGEVGTTAYSNCYAWIPGAANMSEIASMPEARRSHAAAEYNGHIFVFGGYCIGVKNTIFEYNPVTNSWTTKNAVLDPGCSSARAVTIGDRIYILGGNGGSNTVQIYNPINDSISLGPPMPFSTFGHAAAGTLIPQGNTVNTGKIYVSGGLASSSGDPLNTAVLGTVTGVTPNKVEPISLGNLKALYH